MCENWIFSGKVAIAKNLSVHSWLHGEILLDWLSYTDPCFNVALQPCIYTIATPTNIPTQNLQWVYKVSGLALPEFILTCLKLHFDLLKQNFFSEHAPQVFIFLSSQWQLLFKTSWACESQGMNWDNEGSPIVREDQAWDHLGNLKRCIPASQVNWQM